MDVILVFVPYGNKTWDIFGSSDVTLSNEAIKGSLHQKPYPLSLAEGAFVLSLKSNIPERET